MQKAARGVVLGALFVIPFVVLYVSNSLFFPFITGKGFAFRILVEIAFAAWILLALVDKKYRPQFSWTLVLYGAFAVWMFIADAFAVSPLKAFWSNFERMDGWITLIHVFAFFIVAGSVLSVDKLWRTWWLTFIGASALISLYGIGQSLGIMQIHQGSTRLDATLGNSAYLAGYLLFTIAVAIWQGFESKGWLRYTLYILAAIEALLVVFTETRGAVLGLVFGALLATFLWTIESGGRARRIGVGVLAAIVIIAGGIYLARDTGFVQHNSALARVTSIGMSDLAVRFQIWGMAGEGFLARPVTGWGQEGFNYVFQTYYDPNMYGQEPWFDRAHNVFLDWLTAGGAPALLLFLTLLGYAAFALYRKSVSRGERVMLIAALAAYVVQALVVFDNLFTYIPLAALLAMAHVANARPFAYFEKLPHLSRETATTFATPIVIVVGLAVIWFVNIPNIITARTLITALTPASDPMTNLDAFKAAADASAFGFQEVSEQVVSYAGSVASASSIPDATKTAFTSYAIEAMGREVAARPRDARVRLEYAVAYQAAGDLPNALTQLQAALALSPLKQQTLIQKGTVEWQMGDVAAAKADFDKAYEITPGADDLAAYAAAGDILNGQSAASKAILLQHFGTTTVDSNVLVNAYYYAKHYDDLVLIFELHARTDASADAAFRLALAYDLVHRDADARAVIEAAVKAHPEAATIGAQLLKQLGAQ